MDWAKWVLGLVGIGAVASAGKEKAPGADFGYDPGGSGDGPVAMKGTLTPAREALFRRAMHERKSPEAFEGLALQYDRMGLPVEAKMLRARGKARTADQATHEARRKVIRRLMDSRDPAQVERGADICERDLGMTVAAGHLRDYARGLRQAAALSPGGETLDAHGHPLTGPGSEGHGPRTGSHGPAAGAECLVHRTSGSCLVEAPDDDKETPATADLPDNTHDYDRSAGAMHGEGESPYVYPPEARPNSTVALLDSPEGRREVDVATEEGQEVLRRTVAWVKSRAGHDVDVLHAYEDLVIA